MKGRRQIQGKTLLGTPYFISLQQKLGSGSYGQVFRAYNRQNPSQSLAVKIMSLKQQQNRQSIEAELEMIRELPRHQNLVNCVKANISSENNIYIVMQYCNQGSLTNFIKKMTLLAEDKIWNIIMQLCRGYQVLHDANLIHRDLKPDNILIHDKVFKLADFGLSKRIKDHSVKQNLSYAGSPLYIAPEIADKKEGGSKSDVFSLGSIIYELAYDGQQPFYGEKDNYQNQFEYYKRRKAAKLVLKARNKKGQVRSEELRNLIQRMLQFDQDKRISWQQIFEHPRIDINKMKVVPNLQRTKSSQQRQLQDLKRSLIQVNISSVRMCLLPEKDNVRQQTQNMTLELINFQQFLQHKQLCNIEHEMFRLKITQLTIIHCNSKIAYMAQDNNSGKHKKIHKYILDSLQRLLVEGLLYLMKINQIMTNKIKTIEQSVVKQILAILVTDRRRLIQQFKKQVAVFKNMQYQKQLQTINSYDLRRYQHQLYSFLTEYCDFPEQAKHKLLVTVSLLIDVYDSSLKLTDLVQTDKVVWEKYLDISEIETKMDEICYNKLQAHQFYDYIMKKQYVKAEQINSALRKVGLLLS